jgi:alpha-L-rhamnosidase
MRYIFPVKIAAADGDITSAENLLKEKVLQIGLYEPVTTAIKGGGYMVFDFGKELSGGARILTRAAKGEKGVRLRFGESIGETFAELGEKNATNDHSSRDFTVNLSNWSDMTFGQTGFRFLRIDFPAGGEFVIKSVVAACDADERTERGKFTCDDELLNTVWTTAAYTLRLCLKNGYVWDGIKRDRLVWIGDIYPETKTAFCLFDDTPEIKNSLEFCRDQTAEGRWMNDIPNYSAWWIYNLYEYYNRTADAEFVLENLGFVKRIAEDFSAGIEDDGTTKLPFDFVDWGSHYVEGVDDEDKKYDEIAGTDYLLRIVMEKAAYLLEKFGDDASLPRDIIRRLKKKSYTVRKYKQIAALAVLAGEDRAKNLEVIKRGKAEGLTTFLNYFIFKALALCGEFSFAEEMIREYYGKMLCLGATTFWEDFDVKWAENATRIDELPEKGKLDPHGDCGRFCYKGYRHSLCHGWASGVLAYMTEYVAGIRPIDGRPFEYEFAPQLGSLEFVEAVYPTLKGDIVVKARRLPGGGVEKSFVAPDGIKVIEK